MTFALLDSGHSLLFVQNSFNQMLAFPQDLHMVQKLCQSNVQ